MFLEQVKDSVIAQWMAPFVPGEHVFYFYLMSSFVIASATYFWFSRREPGARPEGISKGLFGYIFDKSVWLHRSALQDYGFFAVNTVIYTGIVAHFLISGHVVNGMLERALVWAFGAPDMAVFEPSKTTVIAYTVAVVVAIDLAIFLTHYIQHRIAALWHFHSVHHSAEVLTIATVYRQHPVDLFLTGTATVILTQLAFAGYGYLTLAQPTEYTIMNVNIVIVAFFFIGYNLRHSHIWLSYPPWLSYIFISPAQHQTHHSIDEKHFDRNFGFILAIWDWIAGTLYVPKGYEKLEFGLSREEPNPFGSVAQLFIKPFVLSWGEIRPKLMRWRALLGVTGVLVVGAVLLPYV